MPTRIFGASFFCMLAMFASCPLYGGDVFVDLVVGDLGVTVPDNYIFINSGNHLIVSDPGGGAVVRFSMVEPAKKSRQNTRLAELLRQDYPKYMLTKESDVSYGGLKGVEYALLYPPYPDAGVRAFGSGAIEEKELLVIGQWEDTSDKKRVDDIFRNVRKKNSAAEYQAASKVLSSESDVRRLLRRIKDDTRKSIRVWPKYSECSRCDGKGWRREKDGLKEICTECEGLGHVPVKEEEVDCWDCRATGNADSGRTCKRCKGTGKATKKYSKKEIHIDLPDQDRLAQLIEISLDNTVEEKERGQEEETAEKETGKDVFSAGDMENWYRFCRRLDEKRSSGGDWGWLYSALPRKLRMVFADVAFRAAGYEPSDHEKEVIVEALNAVAREQEDGEKRIRKLIATVGGK